MSAHPHPKPTEQRNPHESSTGSGKPSAQQIKRENRQHRNREEQGEQGNIKQNTTNKGYQQER